MQSMHFEAVQTRSKVRMRSMFGDLDSESFKVSTSCLNAVVVAHSHHVEDILVHLQSGLPEVAPHQVLQVIQMLKPDIPDLFLEDRKHPEIARGQVQAVGVCVATAQGPHCGSTQGAEYSHDRGHCLGAEKSSSLSKGQDVSFSLLLSSGTGGRCRGQSSVSHLDPEIP